MSKLKVIYIAGKMKPENMLNKGWLTGWYSLAEAMEATDYELVVFRLPKQSDAWFSDIMIKIEKLLQDEYGNLLPNQQKG